MRSLLFFSLLALAVHAQDKPPAGLEPAKGPTAGFGCPCQNTIGSLPALPGEDARNLGAVAKGAKLAEGAYVADSVRGGVELAAGTLYVKGDVEGPVRVGRAGAVVFVGGNLKGSFQAPCPFTVIVGGSVEGDVTADHDRAVRVHNRCLLVVGWFPRKPADKVESGGGKPGEPPADDGRVTLEEVERVPNVTARGVFRLTEVVVLGKLEGTIDSQGSGLMAHVDELNPKVARIVGGGQHICFAKFLWSDYPALLRNVLDAKVEFNPTRMTQLTFQRSDVPKGFYRVTDSKLRPKLNGGDAGEVEIRVMEPLKTESGNAEKK